MRNRFLAAVAALALVGTTMQAQAIITNGTVRLGVNALGELNLADPVYGYTGLRYVPTGYESTADGCPCEGWGASYDNSVSGHANQAYGSAGVAFGSFTSSATSATVVGMVGGLEVTQRYAPSTLTSNLYEVIVTLRNTTGSSMSNVRYRRVMDWDIEPTPFYETVELKGWGAANLISMSDNGFQSGDPLAGDGGGCGGILNADVVASGPCDHGASFNFDFGTIAAGGSYTFAIFYGAAAKQSTIHADLALVGATVYSTAWSGSYGPETGPNVFAFGFAGVSGTEYHPTPEPASLALMGTGLLGLVAFRRRRA